MMWRKPILCRLGFHVLDKETYVTITKRRNYGKRHVWKRNYGICKRCGRIVYLVRKEVLK